MCLAVYLICQAEKGLAVFDRYCPWVGESGILAASIWPISFVAAQDFNDPKEMDAIAYAFWISPGPLLLVLFSKKHRRPIDLGDGPQASH
jgi:hypothetical protein